MPGTKLNERDQKYLDNNFTYHAPTPRTMPLYIGMRAAGKMLARMFLTLLPESRERSTALTHLESALFWVNACIARNDDRLPNTTIEVSGDEDTPKIELYNLEVPIPTTTEEKAPA